MIVVMCQVPVSIDYSMHANAKKQVWIQTVRIRMKAMTLNPKAMTTPHFQNTVKVKRRKKKVIRVKRRRKKKMSRDQFQMLQLIHRQLQVRNI